MALVETSIADGLYHSPLQMPQSSFPRNFVRDYHLSLPKILPRLTNLKLLLCAHIPLAHASVLWSAEGESKGEKGEDVETLVRHGSLNVERKERVRHLLFIALPVWGLLLLCLSIPSSKDIPW